VDRDRAIRVRASEFDLQPLRTSALDVQAAMTCSGCGATNADTIDFCAECGLSLGGPVCPSCMWAIREGELERSCPTCHVLHHDTCWILVGGCARYGCANMAEVEKPPEAPTHWGATEKKCPWCAEMIPLDAAVCPACGEKFASARPMSREDLLPSMTDPEVRDLRRRARWLLVFSVLGVTSPLALLMGVIWYTSNRVAIDRAGGEAKVLTLVALGICVLYLVMTALGLLVFYAAGR